MNPALAVALTSHLISNPSPVGMRLWRTLRDSTSLERAEEVVEWSKRALGAADAEAVTTRLELLEDVENELESLGNEGICVITEVMSEYPQRWLEKLGGKHPPLIFVAGNASLLNEPSVGVVGSRDVDEAGSEFAAAVAREIANLGLATVSGGARGVDQIAMRTAALAGGRSIGILADSMSKTVRAGATAEALESGRVCLATPFSPHAPFQVGNAMARNKMVYGLSQATVIVSAAEGSGGTWAGAIEAIDGSLCAVLVRVGAGVPDGNLQLARKGALPISAPSELARLLESAEPTQSALF